MGGGERKLTLKSVERIAGKIELELLALLQLDRLTSFLGTACVQKSKCRHFSNL